MQNPCDAGTSQCAFDTAWSAPGDLQSPRRSVVLSQWSDLAAWGVASAAGAMPSSKAGHIAVTSGEIHVLSGDKLHDLM